MPLLEEQYFNGNDNEVQEEVDSEISSRDLFMPPLEGMDNERNVDDNKAPLNVQVMKVNLLFQRGLR